MNIFQKLSIIGKVQAVYKEVCNQAEVSKEITTCVQNIITEIKKLAELCPKVKIAVDAIKKALKNE